MYDDKRYESRHCDDEFPRKLEKITSISLAWVGFASVTKFIFISCDGRRPEHTTIHHDTCFHFRSNAAGSLKVNRNSRNKQPDAECFSITISPDIDIRQSSSNCSSSTKLFFERRKARTRRLTSLQELTMINIQKQFFLCFCFLLSAPNKLCTVGVRKKRRKPKGKY